MSETSQTSPEQQRAALISEMQSYFDQTQLGSGQIVELGSQFEMASAINRGVGAEQSLLSVIQAGPELFGVVAVTDTKNPDLQANHVLTRFNKDGGRGEIVGLINPGSVLTVGRSQENGYSDKVSRKHFSIGKSAEGVIALSDNRSTNGTRILSTNSEAANTDSNNPLVNEMSWAPSSSEVKKLAFPEDDEAFVDTIERPIMLEKVQEDAGNLAVAENVSVVDSLPVEEPKSNEQAAPVVEISDEPVELEPQEVTPEVQFTTPELTDVFSSPERYDAVMQDDAVDPEFKQQLKALEREWKYVEVAKETSGAWEKIKPYVDTISSSVESAGHWINGLSEQLNGIAHPLNMIQSGLNSRDNGYVQEGIELLTRTFNANDLKQFATEVANLSNVAEAGVSHANNLEETEDAVKQQQNKVYSPNTTEDQQRMNDVVLTMADQGADLSTIRERLNAQRQELESGRSWMSRVSDIESVAGYARLMNSGEVKTAVQNFNQFVDDISSALHSQNVQAISEQAVPYKLDEMMRQLETLNRMSILVRSQIQEAQS